MYVGNTWKGVRVRVCTCVRVCVCVCVCVCLYVIPAGVAGNQVFVSR